MISGIAQYDLGLSPQIAQRVHRLGMSVFDISSEGIVTPVGNVHEGVYFLLKSSRFQKDIVANWHDIKTSDRTVNEVWPGLMLVNIPVKRRRRVGERFSEHALVIVMIGEDLLHCDEIQAVSDEYEIESRNILATLEPSMFVAKGEAARLATMLIWMQEDITEVDRRLNELQSMSLELSESYEELSLLYKLSANMRVNKEPADFLQNACSELQQVLGVRWLAIQLIDNDPRLEDLSGQLVTAGEYDHKIQCIQEIGKYLMLRMCDEEHSVVYEDTAILDVPLIHKLAKTLLIVPIRFEGKQLGILYGGEKQEGTHINTIDVKLCDSLVNSMSIFLGNMMLYEDAQAMFFGTLHALTNAIDAKDSYTHGHSERVALMSRNLAEAAGLDSHTVERTYIAGLLHDVGKIGVPESVLCKPGRLTPSEFDQIKMHPEIGARILQDIRQMNDLIPGVLCHHERWDGLGYPNNLAGDQIPLMGRVIGLADAFDAMSSNRTYRRALDLNQVLDEIIRCKGKQFDPELADIFVNLDFKPFFDLINKHQEHQKIAS
ncbi:HD domain-containing protein [Planctomycetota bacterium]|nr:HD domain-containing protein [Planctomycetota bacterium]